MIGFVDFGTDEKALRAIGAQLAKAAAGDVEATNALAGRIGFAPLTQVLDFYRSLAERVTLANSPENAKLRQRVAALQAESESNAQALETLREKQERIDRELDAAEHDAAMRNRKIAEIPHMFEAHSATAPLVFAFERELKAAGYFDHCRNVRGV
jgi:hypothetical protein